MDIIIIVLLVFISIILLHINSKIPSRDYVNEALERDKKTKNT